MIINSFLWTKSFRFLRNSIIKHGLKCQSNAYLFLPTRFWLDCFCLVVPRLRFRSTTLFITKIGWRLLRRKKWDWDFWGFCALLGHKKRELKKLFLGKISFMIFRMLGQEWIFFSEKFIVVIWQKNKYTKYDI